MIQRLRGENGKTGKTELCACAKYIPRTRSLGLARVAAENAKNRLAWYSTHGPEALPVTSRFQDQRCDVALFDAVLLGIVINTSAVAILAKPLDVGTCILHVANKLAIF